MSKNEKKIYRITDCKKYYDRASLCYLGFAGSWFISLFTASNYDQFIALFAGITCSFFKTKYEVGMLTSYEVKKLQEIYKSILKKYIEVNGKFDFKNPLDVFALFSYAIRNNIFSVNDEREVINSKRFDSLLIRELTLNNHGVCRHVSTMLTDVYKNLGLQSEVGICLRPQMQEVIKPIDETDRVILEQMTEELKKITQFEINGKPITFDDMMMCPPKKIVYEQIPFSKTEAKNGNHAITLVTDEEYTYYLDATNSNVYAMDDDNELITNEGLPIRMMPKQGDIINYRYNVKQGDLKPPAPMEYMISNLQKYDSIIRENEDIVTDFQKDIKDELEEAEEMHRLIFK